MTAPYEPFDPTSGIAESFDLEEMAKELMNDDAFDHSGKLARTLVRTSALTTVLIAMKNGSEMHEHTAPGPAIVTVLSGRVSFKFDNAANEMSVKEGASVAFAKDTPHRVVALEDSAFLLVVGARK